MLHTLPILVYPTKYKGKSAAQNQEPYNCRGHKRQRKSNQEEAQVSFLPYWPSKAAITRKSG